MKNLVLGEKHSFNSYKYKPKQDVEKLRSEKRKFLKEFSSNYGYGGRIDRIREEEYPQLKSEIYLDHTGTTTFPKSLLINLSNDLLNNLYGNPHSNSSSSQASSKRIEDVRERILKYFNTSEEHYNVIFTQNATAAIKLAGEAFPWSKDSTYTYLRESHNSINGVRRFVEAINPENIQSVTEDDVDGIINGTPPTDYYDDESDDVTYNLFAYPAQCNFSGMRFPLSWTQRIKRMNTKRTKTLVLLDAAAYVPSSPLSLADKDASPDFICLSFYKMFGYPTGLGALILKTELNPILRKGFFGGGTIDSVTHDIAWQVFSKNITTRYEDGTVNFLNIIALDHAFDSFERIYGNVKNISKHVTSLNTYLSRIMKSFRHWNGQTVCKVNSDREFSDSKRQGGIFSFNVKRSDGSFVGYSDLEKLASTYGIHIRAGSNCNPGSITRWNDVKSEQIIEDFAEVKTCSASRDEYKGKLFGAVRVSIGAMTTIEDILIWLEFFKRNYVEIMPGKTMKSLNVKSVKDVKYIEHKDDVKYIEHKDVKNIKNIPDEYEYEYDDGYYDEYYDEYDDEYDDDEYDDEYDDDQLERHSKTYNSVISGQQRHSKKYDRNQQSLRKYNSISSLQNQKQQQHRSLQKHESVSSLRDQRNQQRKTKYTSMKQRLSEFF